MFSLASGIYQSYFAPPKLSILIIGLDGSGKTSLLERIKVTDIQTKIDINAAAVPSKGGAVAGVSSGSGNSGAENRQRQQRRGGQPARLPPPLPPKQALKSSQLVEKAMEDGFTCARKNGQENAIGIDGVPPPPLVVESGNSDISMSSTSSDNQSNQISNAPKSPKPPRPPRNDAIPKAANPAQPELEATPTKKKSFIELLRCPSPQRYSSAAEGEDEGEYHDDDPAKNTPEPWNTEYLIDYHIDYKEGEEFDIRKHRAGGGNAKKMFPMDKIRPTLGQNLAKLDLCGCKCSLFDLSGAEKMRPLWERYFRDTDGIIYVVNAAESSFSNLHQSRLEFEQMCQNDTLQRRVQCGLPILIFANQLDVAYKEYETSIERANKENFMRGISWNADEEDDFVGGGNQTPSAATAKDADEGPVDVSNRVVDFHDLAKLFGFPQQSLLGEDSMHSLGNITGNVSMFGGSAKSGEGVRAAMEHLVAHSKSYHLSRHARHANI